MQHEIFKTWVHLSELYQKSFAGQVTESVAGDVPTTTLYTQYLVLEAYAL